MPRKRMLAPSFWRDEKIARCSHLERLLFQGLWTFAEDSGAGRANPLLLKADIFPYDPVSEDEIARAMEKLQSLGLITLYESGSQRYYFVTNFKKHQTINRPTPSTLPLPGVSHSLSAQGGLMPQDNIIEDNINFNISEVTGAKGRCPPTKEEVSEYCASRKNNVDAEHFFDHYTANGWTQGSGKPIVDWRAAVRTWEKNEARFVGAAKGRAAASGAGGEREQEDLERIRAVYERVKREGG